MLSTVDQVAEVRQSSEHVAVWRSTASEFEIEGPSSPNSGGYVIERGSSSATSRSTIDEAVERGEK